MKQITEQELLSIKIHAILDKYVKNMDMKICKNEGSVCFEYTFDEKGFRKEIEEGIFEFLKGVNV